MQTMNVHH